LLRRQAVSLYGRRASSDVYLSQVVEIMRKLDTDRDGVLTRHEFVHGCSNDPEIASMLLGGLAPRSAAAGHRS